MPPIVLQNILLKHVLKPAARLRSKIVHSYIARFGAGRPVLRAVIVFAVLMGLFYGLLHTPLVGSDPFRPYLGLIARVTGGILGLFGHEASVVYTLVSSPAFSMEIVRGCDAIEPAAAFAAAVPASPVSFWSKIPGLLAGTAALLVINLARLVSLFVDCGLAMNAGTRDRRSITACGRVLRCFV